MAAARENTPRARWPVAFADGGMTAAGEQAPGAQTLGTIVAADGGMAAAVGRSTTRLPDPSRRS
jgi:hypothetical protein